MGKEKVIIICPECFGNPEIDVADAPGHLKQHWDKEPDPVLCPEAYFRFHDLRNQILDGGGEL